MTSVQLSVLVCGAAVDAVLIGVMLLFIRRGFQRSFNRGFRAALSGHGPAEDRVKILVIRRPDALSREEQAAWLRQVERAYGPESLPQPYICGIDEYVCRLCQGPTPYEELCEGCLDDMYRP